MRCAVCWEPTEVAPCGACGADPLLAGRYRLLEPVGEGAVGVTWRAQRVADGVIVAVKELPFRKARSDKERQLLDREAAVLRTLSHPGIPALYEAFEAGRGRARALFLVLEFVDGRTLEAEAADVRYDEVGVLRILEELLDVLAYLHGLSPPVIHRDVKPRNVMRRPDGRLALVDFGSVRDALRDADLGGSTVAGTFGFMAPEQFHGDASPATDLFGLGALAIALLTRRDPASLQDWHQRFRWRAHATVSPWTADLIDALLAPEPTQRPRSADDAKTRVILCRLRCLGEAPPREVPPAPLTLPTPDGPPPRPAETVSRLLDVVEPIRVEQPASAVLLEALRQDPLYDPPPALPARRASGVPSWRVAALPGLLGVAAGGLAVMGLAVLAGLQGVVDPPSVASVVQARLAAPMVMPTRGGPPDFDRLYTEQSRIPDCLAGAPDTVTGARLDVRLLPPNIVEVQVPPEMTPLERCVLQEALSTPIPDFVVPRTQWVEVWVER